jgi:hypothetical protein
MPLFNTSKITLQNPTTTVCNTTFISVGTTSVNVVPNEPNRKSLTLENRSQNSIYIGFSTSPSATSFAIELPPGAYYELPSPIYTAPINAIASTGTTNVLVVNSFS